jgi:hypothetical protein
LFVLFCLQTAQISENLPLKINSPSQSLIAN